MRSIQCCRPDGSIGGFRVSGRCVDRGIGVLITDHNVRETLAITDRAYIIVEGKILTDGTADELIADEQVRRIYLGERFSR